jgi:hypothetical protein
VLATEFEIEICLLGRMPAIYVNKPKHFF